MAFRYKSNTEGFLKQFDQVGKFLKERAGNYERVLVMQLNERIMALTPVWEGETMVNYVWSVRSPLLVTNLALGSGDPGRTGSMPLGPEPRRAANEAAVRAELVKVLAAQMPADIYLTNSAPDVVPLEYGLNPTPETSRVRQGGMVRLAIKEVVGALHGY